SPPAPTDRASRSYAIPSTTSKSSGSPSNTSTGSDSASFRKSSPARPERRARIAPSDRRGPGHSSLVRVSAHGPPRPHRDPQDHQRDSEPDQGISPWEPERHDDCRADDRRTDISVGASVFPVSDQGRTLESPSRS